MKKVTQILSITLSSALALSSTPWPAAAVGPVAEMPAFAQALAPAESLGYVASSYSPNADVTRPRLIVIADLHAHVEVQHHIVDMLDGLVNKLTTGAEAQKQVPIFVEGGWQPHLEHPLASVQNPKLRAIMAEYFLQKAEIPATQAFSERHPNATNFTLTGVENKDEYEANRERFIQSYPVRRRLLEAIARHEDSLKDLSSSVEARSYQKLQDMRQAYQSGTLPGDRYARALVRQAARFNIQNRYVELLQRSDASSQPEFDLALSEVSRLVSLKLAESRPISAIFRGDEKMVRQNIATIDAYLDLLKRTLSNQLTPEEVPFAYARIPQMAQVAQILTSSESLGIDVPNALEQSLAFYPFAFMRNDSLIENSLASLQKSGPTGTGILVVGGFHSEAISQYLQEHQIPYLLINPIVSRDLSTSEQLNYVERMAGDHVTENEARADFSQPFGQAIVTRASTSITPISNLADAPLTGDIAATVVPAVTTGMEGAAKVESQLPATNAATPTDKDKNKNPSDGTGTSSFDSSGSKFWATLTAAQRLAQEGVVVVDKTNGISQLIDESVRTSLSDEVANVIRSAHAPLEAQLVPSKSVSYQRDASGVYSAFGPLGNEFSLTFASVLHTIPEQIKQEVEAPQEIIIQGMKGPALAAFALKMGQVETEAQAEQTSFVTVGIGGKKVVILYDVDKDLTNSTAMHHELTHALTGGRYEAEDGVQSIAIASKMREMAEEAAGTSADDALFLGLKATSMPTFMVHSALKSINKNELPNRPQIFQGFSGETNKWNSPNPMSFPSILETIFSAIKPRASTKLASDQVAAIEDSIRAQFADVPADEVDKVFDSSVSREIAAFSSVPGGKALLTKRLTDQLKALREKAKNYAVVAYQA